MFTIPYCQFFHFQLIKIDSKLKTNQGNDPVLNGPHYVHHEKDQRAENWPQQLVQLREKIWNNFSKIKNYLPLGARGRPSP